MKAKFSPLAKVSEMEITCVDAQFMQNKKIREERCRYQVVRETDVAEDKVVSHVNFLPPSKILPDGTNEQMTNGGVR